MTLDIKALDKMVDKIVNYQCKPEFQKSICDGEIRIGDICIPCAVIEDGIRVISQRQTLIALGRSKQGSSNDAIELPVILRANNLKPFIPDDLTTPLNYIKYQPKSGGKLANGVRAEVLPRICEVFINARNAGALKQSQIKTAEQCQILQNGFARIGITALVDEATGYQDIRAKNALVRILEKYLAPEIQKWTKTFPLDFYREIYRLKEWEWGESEVGKKPYTPSIVGRYTDDLIYKRIAPGILDELRNKNPDKRVRHHQWFDPEHGHPKLKEHIAGIIALMRASDTWEQSKKLINKSFPISWEEGTLFYGEHKQD